MLPRIEHIKYSVYLIVVRILKGPGSGGACLQSYLGGRSRRIQGSRFKASLDKEPYLKNKIQTELRTQFKWQNAQQAQGPWFSPKYCPPKKRVGEGFKSCLSKVSSETSKQASRLVYKILSKTQCIHSHQLLYEQCLMYLQISYCTIDFEREIEVLNLLSYSQVIWFQAKICLFPEFTLQ